MRALIFDLDGTLVDTVYAHVFAWQQALDEAGLPVDGWRVHRRIGMSGGLFTRAVARETGQPLDPERAKQLQDRHGEIFRTLLPRPRPLPGAPDGSSCWQAAAAVVVAESTQRTFPPATAWMVAASSGKCVHPSSSVSGAGATACSSSSR